MSIGPCRRAVLTLLLAGLAGLPGFSERVRAQETRVQVTVGDTTTLELDGNPSTGYAWAIDKVPKSVTVDLLGYAKRELAPGERPVLGAPQKFQVLVTGVAPGTATLVFKYVRANDPKVAKTQEVSAEVVGEAPDASPEEEGSDPPQDSMENPGEQMFDDGADK